MKVFFSLSSWLATPAPGKSVLVSTLTKSLTVRKTQKNDYFLMDGEEQAGSLSVRKFAEGPKLSDKEYYWIDNVFLEPPYRGKDLLKRLVKAAAVDSKKTRLLLDANKHNVTSYEAAGFVILPKDKLLIYKKAIDEHRKLNNYSKLKDQYVPMMYVKAAHA